MHVTFNGYYKNQLNTRNIYSIVIFLDEQELFYIIYSIFPQEFF